MSGTTRAKMLITGGAGFIGSHCISYFSRKGFDIVVVDNLSRKGVTHNLQWLQESFHFRFNQSDICDYFAMQTVFQQEGPFDVIIHLAAQVAVTTSVLDPQTDFDINARGSLNILECFRQYSPGALLIYSSTNKVYGELSKIQLIEGESRYQLPDRMGISESQPLDFHSPYGCSKGSADQYVIDYARIYGLHTVSFRQSCIYGERQFGVEDQGWVAWFIIAASLGIPITICGNGKQVRDLLHIDDLVNLYDQAIIHQDILRGEVFNVGGGFSNSLSLLEFLELLQKKKIAISYSFGATRPGDQHIFISDNTKAKNILNWEPTVFYQDGITRLIDWISHNQELLKYINDIA
jgi:CDP-paratose 2-epimerase